MTGFAAPQLKKLPLDITSYDLLKAAAVIIMVVDHVGYYFENDQFWWRAVGRIGFPIWFFLVGYARSRDFSARMWVGGGILAAASLIAGQSVFPLNALFSMIIIRIMINPMMKAATHGLEIFGALCVVLTVTIIPSFSVCEYGTQGLLMAMFGYMVRNRPQIPEVRDTGLLIKLFAVFSFAHFFVLQSFMFMFSLPQMLVMAGGLAVTCWLLYAFRAMEFPRLTRALPRPVTAIIQFMGRRTLEIYVAHLVLFKFIGMAVDPGRFSLFHWVWVM